MFGLFAADRAEHIRRVILPAFVEGKVVVSDRFATATFAYQACAMDNPISETLFREYYKDLDLRPDLTVILDLDPEVSQARVASRATQALTHFDARPAQFHELLRSGYRQFARTYDLSEGSAVKIVSAEGDTEEVHGRILEHMQGLLRT
jgi:dTMP kinase